jgi:hypothetical protein
MDTTNQNRFVLKAIDPQTECVAFDAAFEVADVRELPALLGLSAGDFDPRLEYELDRSDIDRIKRHFNVEFEPGELRVALRPWVLIDALPYKVHTNRELVMMLAGMKPLAAFVSESNADDEFIPERMFDPYVKSGRFLKHEHVESRVGRGGREFKLRRVLYAQPDQQWRIPAYLLLWKTSAKSGWNEGFERMEGSLLGYEDWQNDAYIELTRRHTGRPEGTQSDTTHIKEQGR